MSIDQMILNPNPEDDLDLIVENNTNSSPSQNFIDKMMPNSDMIELENEIPIQKSFEGGCIEDELEEVSEIIDENDQKNEEVFEVNSIENIEEIPIEQQDENLPILESEQKVEQQENVVENLPKQVRWILPLKEVACGQTFELNEYNQKYKFQRIVDPDGKETKKFLVFLNDDNKKDENGKLIWNTLSGVLSDIYVVASMEEFVNLLTKQLKFIGQPIIRKEPFKVSWSTKSTQNIKYFEDDAAKMIFSLVSGVGVKTLDNLSSTISIVLSNSYDGSRKMRLDYVVQTAGIVNGQGDNVNLVDYFVLCNHSHQIIHTGQISEIESDLSSVQEHIDSNLAIFKNTTSNSVLEKIVKNISKCFKKEGRQQFVGLCENLSGPYKNAYYILLMASIVLEKNYSVLTYNKIKSVSDKIHNDIF